MAKAAKTMGIADSIAEKLVDQIISAIADHSGDPRRLAPDVSDHSVDSWRSARLRAIGMKGVGWGAVEGGVPIVGVLALIPDLRMLIGDSVRLAWGIGELKGCRPMGAADALEIMALWSGSESHGFRPVSTSFARSINSALDLSDGLWELFETPASDEEHVDSWVDTLAAYNDLYALGSSGVDLYSELSSVREATQASAATMATKKAAKLSAKLASKGVAKTTAKVAPKILAKTSSKMAAKAAAHVVQHGTTSWIPFLGAFLGAGAGLTINSWFARDFADAASDYYSNPLKV